MKNVASLNLSVNSFPLAWKIQINTSPFDQTALVGLGTARREGRSRGLRPNPWRGARRYRSNPTKRAKVASGTPVGGRAGGCMRGE